MPESSRFRRFALPRSRRLTVDVLHYHRKVPTCAHDRRTDVGRVAQLRSQLPVRVSWPILFIKAFALVAQKRPVLRQTYLTWPWPHVCENPYSVAMLPTHRDHLSEPWLFWSRFSEPENRPLVELQQALDRFQSEPVEKIFKQQWQLSALPTFLRRVFWWWTLNMAGAKRAKRVGTFFLTTLSGKGVEIQDPPAFMTSNLTYGPIDESGCCRVTLSYDHRLMDGSLVADCLIDLESTLSGEIARELESIIADAQRNAA